MKKFLFLMLLILITGCVENREYGVFIGIGSERISKLSAYKTVVIEPENFTKEEVEHLKSQRKEVYAYLNIGALEEYRHYCDRYKECELGAYENWDDEVWIDVSKKEWQFFLVNDLGKKYKDKGFDGFFIDNADVYYHYQDEKIYQGLVEILKGLKENGSKIIINGGDVFVSRVLYEASDTQIFDAVNQETVFTSINFSEKTYGRSSDESREYFCEYLKKVKDSGKEVYLLEYSPDFFTKMEIKKYCEENDMKYFISPDLSLTND